MEEQHYQNLDAEKISILIGRMKERITDRFPDSGLRKVSEQLHQVSLDTAERIVRFSQPIVSLRIGSLFLALCIILLAGAAILQVKLPGSDFHLAEFLQSVEAAINDVLFIGAAIFFLVTLESRIKRSKVLAAIHELRSIAHIIDMHQLNKDPQRVIYSPEGGLTSPRHSLSAYDLNRYLDYCSELLSLTGKIAALYGQRFNDGVVLAAVTEIENLTTDLSQKLWQKLMILQLSQERGNGVIDAQEELQKVGTSVGDDLPSL